MGDAGVASSNGVGLSVGIDPIELWRHDSPQSTQMWDFIQRLNKKFGLKLATYEELYQWSIENVGEFWGEVWGFVGVKASKDFDEVSLDFVSCHVIAPHIFKRSYGYTGMSTCCELK